MKTYTSWTQLGITDISTWTSWVGVLPASSELVVTVGATQCKTLYTNGIIPYNSVGCLRVVNSNSRGFGTYFNGGVFCVGFSNNMNSEEFYWVKVAMADKFLPLTVAAANYLQKSAFSYSNGTLTITI